MALPSGMRRLLPWLEGVVSLALIFLAASKVPWKDLELPTLSVPAVGWVTLAVTGATIVSAVYETWRLSLLRANLEQRPMSFSRLLRLQLRSRPWAFLLPGSIAADGYLALQLPTHEERSKLARALLAQRAWGLSGWMFTLSIFLSLSNGLSLLSEQWPLLAHPACWAVLGVAGAAGGLLLWPSAKPWNLILVSLSAPW